MSAGYGTRGKKIQQNTRKWRGKEQLRGIEMDNSKAITGNKEGTWLLISVKTSGNMTVLC